MPNFLYNRQIKPAGTAGNAVGNIDTSSPYRELGRAGDTLADLGLTALSQIQREKKIQEAERERVEREVEQAQYHDQYNQGVTEFYQLENDLNQQIAKEPDINKWKGILDKQKQTIPDRFKKFNNPRAYKDLTEIQAGRYYEEQRGRLFAEGQKITAQKSVTRFKLTTDIIAERIINAPDPITAESGVLDYANVFGYKSLPVGAKADDVEGLVSFKDYSGRVWNFEPVKDFYNPVFNDDTNRKLAFEAGLADISQKRGVVYQKQQDELEKANIEANNKWVQLDYDTAAATGDPNKVEDVFKRTGQYNKKIPPPVNEQMRMKAIEDAKKVVEQKNKDKNLRDFDAVEGENNAIIDAGMSIEAVKQAQDNTKKRGEEFGLDNGQIRQLQEHARGYWNSLVKYKESKADGEKQAIKQVLSDAGIGKIDLRSGQDFDNTIEKINKSAVLSDTEKTEWIKAMQYERSHGTPDKTNQLIANNLTGDIYGLMAAGKNTEEIQGQLDRARYIDRTISQPDYLYFSDLAKKKYTPSIALGLKGGYDYGKAKIGDDNRLNLFNRAMLDFVNQRIEKGDLTIQMIQQQAVIFAGQSYPANYSLFNKLPETNRPKIEPMLTADKELDEDTVTLLRQEADGDEYLAMKLARERGYKWDEPSKINYGLREDGTPKGRGYFGELKRPDGKISTELSIGIEFDGKEILIPSLVPTLTQKEIDYLLAGNRPTPEITKKAVEHARKRIKEGKLPFAD